MSFGHASLWPFYLYIGAQSKYTCAKLSSFAAHHLAYIPKVNQFFQFYLPADIKQQLDNSIQEFYIAIFGEPVTEDTLRHLRWELIHAIWCILLDDDFIDAYGNGVVIMFPDGIQHRLFPQFFTDSADYPEK
jgi:hypothetical protein